MAVIPIYQQRSQLGGIPQMRRARAAPVPGIDLEPLREALDGVVRVEMRMKLAERERNVRQNLVTSQVDLLRASGEIAADSDYGTQSDRFQAARDQIEQQTRERFGDDEAAFQTWKSDFDMFALRQEFDIRSSATKGMRETQAAGLEMDLEQFAAVAAQADPASAQELRNRGLLAINDALGRGVISPMEAVKRQTKYKSDIVGAQVRWDIYNDPSGAEQKLLGGEYGDLTGDDRVRLLERATAKAQAEETRRLANETRGLAMSARAERRMQDDVSKEGDDLLGRGTLSPDWLEANRRNMSASDYRYFQRELMEERAGPAQSDPMVYADLLEMADRGDQPVRGAAREALMGRQITREDFDRVVARGEKDRENEPSWMKRGNDYISRYLKPSDLNPDPASSATYANASEDFRKWADRNPQAKPEEAEREYRRIAENYVIAESDQIPLLQRVPRDLVGSRAMPDLEATEAATVERFMAKHGGDVEALKADPEYLEQAEIIGAYRASQERLQQIREGR